MFLLLMDGNHSRGVASSGIILDMHGVVNRLIVLAVVVRF
jgi:hypothetical protein